MDHHYVVGVNTELGPEEWKRDPATIYRIFTLNTIIQSRKSFRSHFGFVVLKAAFDSVDRFPVPVDIC